MENVRKDQQMMTQIKKYRAEIIIAVGGAALSVIIDKVIDIYWSVPAADRVMLSLLGVVILFLLGQMFIIKRNVIWKIGILQERVDQISGHFAPSQYDERKHHFAEEKHRIVENLTQIALPPLVEKAFEKKTSDESRPVAVVVDSGTTLEQFFPRAKLMGFGPNLGDTDLRRIQIYTNSLSGSDAFCKMPANYLHEDQLHLFGGTQIEKYRAVLGEVTLAAVNTVKDEYLQKQGKIIGIITANWLLVGAAYDKLIFCSTEQGHLDFKRLLAEMSDELIVTAPLGKLLTLDTTAELNTILRLKEEGKPEYEGFEINSLAKRRKDNTTLLTTYRSKSNSILYTHSEKLLMAHNNKKHELYTLCKKTRSFILDFNCSDDEQIELEMPHHYLREHAFTVLQVHKR